MATNGHNDYIYMSLLDCQIVGSEHIKIIIKSFHGEAHFKALPYNAVRKFKHVSTIDQQFNTVH